MTAMTPMTRILRLITHIDKSALTFLHGVKPATQFRASTIDQDSYIVMCCSCPSQFTQCCTLGTGEGDSLPSIPRKIKSRASTPPSARFGLHEE